MEEELESILLRPFELGSLSEGVLSGEVGAVLNPRTRVALKRCSGERVSVWQPDRSSLLAIGAAKPRLGGIRVSGGICDGGSLLPFSSGGFPLVASDVSYVLVTLYRETARDWALLSHLWESCDGNPWVVCTAANAYGARKLQKGVEIATKGRCNGLSKAKGRVWWFRLRDLDPSLLPLNRRQPIEITSESGHVYETPAGTFSQGEEDQGSRILVETMKQRGALNKVGPIIYDLGAGWGYVTGELVSQESGTGNQARSWTLYESDLLSAVAAERNLGCRKLPQGVKVEARWGDVLQEVPAASADVVVMNPPFHERGREDYALGIGFIEAAITALKPTGVLWMVANRHLPYEATLSGRVRTFEEVCSVGGFKVLRAMGKRS